MVVGMCLTGQDISTHAPLARCNKIGSNIMITGHKDFYSRTSCEVQRTLPASIVDNAKISTHAPLARCNSYILCNLTIAPLYKVDRLKLIV